MLFYCIINVIKHNINRGGSHIDLPNRIKSKTAKINPINKKDNKAFQHVIPVVQNQEKIKKRSAKNNKK